MEFVALIIVLTFRTLLELMPSHRHDRWFYALKAQLQAVFKKPAQTEKAEPDDASLSKVQSIGMRPIHWLSGTGTFISVVILPVVALSLSLSVLEEMMWGIPAFALSLLILFYSLGRKENVHWFNRFQLAWRQRDIQGAYQYATELSPSLHAENEEKLYQKVFSYLLLLSFRDFFLVLFWFVLLGAEGALLVRLTLLFLQADERNTAPPPVIQTEATDSAPVQLVAQEESAKVQRWQHLVEWLPARLLAICFMLTGNFCRSGQQWFSLLDNPRMSHSDLLTEFARSAINTGKGAVSIETEPALLNAQSDEQLKELKELLKRSAAFWVICISLYVTLA